MINNFKNLFSSVRKRCAKSTFFYFLCFLRRYNAAGNDKFQAFFNRHFQKHQIFPGDKNQKAGSRVGSGGDKDVNHLPVENAPDFAAGIGADKSQNPDAFARIFEQSHPAERLAFVGKKRFKHLFQQRVDAGNDRHLFDHPVAEADKKAADKPGGKHTDQNHRNDEDDHAEPGNGKRQVVIIAFQLRRPTPASIHKMIL